MIKFQHVCDTLNEIDRKFFETNAHDISASQEGLRRDKINYALSLDGEEREYAFDWIRRQ